jgi:hypothetical protein
MCVSFDLVVERSYSRLSVRSRRSVRQSALRTGRIQIACRVVVVPTITPGGDMYIGGGVILLILVILLLIWLF